MRFFIENRTYGLADINLYTGSRKCLEKGESFPLGHEPTESEKKYYRKMNCIGIYLVEENDPEVSEIINNTYEDTDEIDSDEYAASDTSVFNEGIDYSKESFNDLMKFRHAELVEIARRLGHTDFSEDYSKKEIVRLIRGG